MTEIRNVDVAEALDLLATGALLLDVRELDEWEGGHASDATHAPLSEVPDHVERLPRDRVIVCVCRSGGRSARAARFLAEQGLDVVNLMGGMTAWAEHGAPLVAESDADPEIK
jgi:rhodanese-related sulfurtransferase